MLVIVFRVFNKSQNCEGQSTLKPFSLAWIRPSQLLIKQIGSIWLFFLSFWTFECSKTAKIMRIIAIKPCKELLGNFRHNYSFSSNWKPIVVNMRKLHSLTHRGQCWCPSSGAFTQDCTINRDSQSNLWTVVTFFKFSNEVCWICFIITTRFI